MVAVVVRDDHVVELPKSGLASGRLHDAVRVSMAGVTRINQHGLASGRDNQCRGPALDVDPIDVEPAISLVGARGPRTEAKQGQ